MDKQAELEQAYRQGFETKLAELDKQSINKHMLAQGLGLAGGTLGAIRGAFKPTDKRSRLANMLRSALVGYGGGVGATYGGAALGGLLKNRTEKRIRGNEEMMNLIDETALNQYNELQELPPELQGNTHPVDISNYLVNIGSTVGGVPGYVGGGLLGLLGGRQVGKFLGKDPADVKEKEEKKDLK